jgi:catechol 2,3-dioxygenase-like lactoylglutathione lyase family enzyme
MDLKHAMPVLFVKDARKSKTFYSDLLEMTIVGDFGGMNIIFEEGFALWQIMEKNIIPQKLGSENIYNVKATSRFELCFETEDLDTAYKKFKENNVQFSHEINTDFGGNALSVFTITTGI